MPKLLCLTSHNGFARVAPMADSGHDKIRTLRADDIPAAFALSAQAGWNQTEEDWGTLLTLAPESCLAVEVNGDLAATTTLLCYGRKLAWIGMVLTKPEFQRRGLARQLLARCLERADKMEIETIKLDATDQGRPLYEKFGFRAEQEIHRWSRPGKNVASFSSGGALAPQPWRASDLASFGADRSQLLTRLADRHSPRTLSQSYLFSRPGRLTGYLGPFISENPETARQLIAQRMQNADEAWCWDLFPQKSRCRSLGQRPRLFSAKTTPTHDPRKGISRQGTHHLRHRWI